MTKPLLATVTAVLRDGMSVDPMEFRSDQPLPDGGNTPGVRREIMGMAFRQGAKLLADANVEPRSITVRLEI